MKNYLTDIDGILVGHAESLEGVTGCTVVICEEGATGGVDVRGSAPGTRETDLLRADKMVDRVHGIVLAGGSAYGLEAASGVMTYLEERKIGFNVGKTVVPIIPSAVIFDIDMGDYRIRPDKKMGYEAASLASCEENRRGNVGCGLGASVGKILGKENSMKGGLGSHTIVVGDLIVSALVVVNAFGDVFKEGYPLAGPYLRKDEKLLNTIEIMCEKNESLKFANKNTTIGIVATNGRLNKAEGNKFAEMAHNGLARSINPIHTNVDGDTIFSLATNKVDGDINLIGTLGARAMELAVVDAIENAKTIDGVIALCDI